MPDVDIEKTETEESVREPPLKRKREHVSVVEGEREKAMLLKETFIPAIRNTQTNPLSELIVFVTTSISPVILID